MDLVIRYIVYMPIDIWNGQIDRTGYFTMTGIIIIPDIQQGYAFLGQALIQMITRYIFNRIIPFK
ncbi:hypothetical protein [Cytobacillus firmus]|uniref:hypothetical protein n=1 Tax=Cytobacillus firmus TaxID=1399 RepID=UPI001C978F25|nr:hypothetical protein [Cytobacillus firmus]MBY6053874.1 hypothetical protein [Cytobacillus firmus]